jgi:hypothetical protein
MSSEEWSFLMKPSRGLISAACLPGGQVRPGRRGQVWSGLAVLGLYALLSATASAQPLVPQLPEMSERSGLVQRFAGTPNFLPHDPRRDNFYLTRYGDNGTLSHVNWFRSQGLYGLGWKTPDTQSIYPFWYGSPGQNTISSSSKPWPRPLRFFQGLVHPWRPVGMYYQMGTYVPVYDLDPIAPGPGPYPYPFYFNFDHGG